MYRINGINVLYDTFYSFGERDFLSGKVAGFVIWKTEVSGIFGECDAPSEKRGFSNP
jgi:hypothetical protein